ncbi:FUSC family protein [Acidisphaera sp. S103]|uniref:FUSC family protein n=1 Tax=Acidisphaera sp. S103 TaxID=1747223 RepID=UPI00131BE12E|nr:FUSC family protein [Acidisphaera sp. S103]
MSAVAIRIVREAIAGTYRDLGEVRLTGPRGRRCAVTTLAVALAVVVALAVHVDDALWAAISAFVCSQATAPASVQRGALRILGTFGGATLAVLASPLLAGDDVALILTLLAVSTAGVLGQLVGRYGYAWLLGAVTADMVLMALLSDPGSALAVGVNRSAEVTIGTVAAMTVALLLGAPAAAAPAIRESQWTDLLGEQWPSMRHAIQAGVGVMLIPLVWRWLELPNMGQSAITVAAAMAVPALTNDAAIDQAKITERAIHRILGCLLGGVAGLACLTLSIDNFLLWLLALSAGIWVAAHVQASERGVSYVGTQFAVVLISTLVQGSEPPASIWPGIERFVGITGGVVILLAVVMLTSPEIKPPAAPPESALCRNQ